MEPTSFKQVLIKVPPAASLSRFKDLHVLERWPFSIPNDNHSDQQTKVENLPVIDEEEVMDCTKFEQFYLM